MLDEHSSHYCPEAIRYAAEQQVIIFTFPANTTCLMQSLEKGMFAPLKVAWRQAVHDYQVKHPGRVISKHNFSSIFSEAWLRSMTPVNILSGFRTTGVYPVNRCPGEDVVSNLYQKTGISYILFYKRRISQIPVASLSFTPKELLKFEHRFVHLFTW